MKIYTKTGDQGDTSRYDGMRVPKDHALIHLNGLCDELIVAAGALAVVLQNQALNRELIRIQSVLFSYGAAISGAFVDEGEKLLFVDACRSHLDALEIRIDELQSILPPLHNFVLPGGCEANIRAHFCRVSTRRLERHLVHCIKEVLRSEDIWVQVFLAYINRLSDYFFVFSRYLAHQARVDEIIWTRPDTLPKDEE